VTLVDAFSGLFQDGEHLVARKRQRWSHRDLRILDLAGRIRLDPTVLAREAKKTPESLEFFQCREIVVFPGRAKFSERRSVELLHEANALQLCELFEVAEQQPVLVDGFVFQLSRFSVREKLFLGFVDRHRFTVIAGWEFAGGFPFPNRVLRFFPIARTERLPDLVAADESVDPDRATAAAVLSPFVAVLAIFTSISVCPDRKSGVPNWIASWPTLIGGASTS